MFIPTQGSHRASNNTDMHHTVGQVHLSVKVKVIGLTERRPDIGPQWGHGVVGLSSEEYVKLFFIKYYL